MRGPDSLPSWVTRDTEGWDEPILTIPCPCCNGLDEAGSRVCLTYIEVMTKELAAFLAQGTIPLEGVTGWVNGGVDTALTGCLKCGSTGVVPVDAETEEML